MRMLGVFQHRIVHPMAQLRIQSAFEEAENERMQSEDAYSKLHERC